MEPANITALDREALPQYASPRPRSYQPKNQRVSAGRRPEPEPETEPERATSTEIEADVEADVDDDAEDRDPIHPAYRAGNIDATRYQPLSDALSLPSPQKPRLRRLQSDYVYGISPRRSSLRWQRELRVQLRTFKGRTMVHIREWFAPQVKRAAWRAGVGISFPPFIDMLDGHVYPTLDTVIDALCKIRDDVNNGVIVLDPDLVGVDGVEEAQVAYDHAAETTGRDAAGA